MADSIIRKFFESAAQIHQACGRKPFLLAMAALLLAALTLFDLLLFAAGSLLLAVLAAAGSGSHFAVLGFYVLVLLNFLLLLFSLLLVCFSVSVSVGLPRSQRPPAAAAKLLKSKTLALSKMSLSLSAVMLFFLLLAAPSDLH